MKRAIEETTRRRGIQEEYNRVNDITPQSILKPVDSTLLEMTGLDYYEVPLVAEAIEDYGSADEIEVEIERLRTGMKEKAQEFQFEQAAKLRDKIKVLEQIQLEFGGSENDD
jgi:excinuclease ABC subunit B